MKNPYTTRAGLLGQAEGILRDQYHQKYEHNRYLVEKGILDPKKVTWPTPPTTAEILNEAEKLYEFVKKK